MLSSLQPYQIENIKLARNIADIAHTGQGQFRADGTTPYISHPTRVANLVNEWYANAIDGWTPMSADYEVCMAAAFLHDVIEDTHITQEDLLRWGVSPAIVEVVLLLTKPDVNAPSPLSYYEGIASNKRALLVKAADRASNIEDALIEVQNSRKLKRWKNYVTKTYEDVLPMYIERAPFLYQQLENRLIAIEMALDTGDVS